jgi:hypothetical protein
VPIEVTGRETLAIPEIKVARGRPEQVLIVGEDRKPIAGATAVFLQRRPLTPELVAGSSLTFIHNRPHRAYSTVIIHKERGLGGCVDIMGDEAGPIEVMLRPLGAVRGRLVDEQTAPRPNVQIQATYLRDQGPDTHVDQLDAAVTTGPDSSFQIERLVPGLFYSFEVLRPHERHGPLQSEGYLWRGRWTLKPGRLDWGDIQVTK